MSDFKKTWIEGFNELAIKLARNYKENPEQVLASIGFKSVLDCLLETYNNLIGDNQITKLEDLETERKQILWDQSGKYSDEKFKRIAICKCLYLLDVLTAEL